MNDTLRKIEALLFLSGEAVSYQELARLCGQDVATSRRAVAELRDELQHHGLTIVTTDTHAQLTTSADVTSYLRQFIQGETQQLSSAAAETLTIVAYRGPISRLDIETLRGVDCRRMIRQLLARGLIRRQKSPGQWPRYSITEEFLHYLGLTRREDLPRFEELCSHAKIEQLLQAH